jgi:hypothetical protein
MARFIQHTMSWHAACSTQNVGVPHFSTQDIDTLHPTLHSLHSARNIMAQFIQHTIAGTLHSAQNWDTAFSTQFMGVGVQHTAYQHAAFST